MAISDLTSPAAVFDRCRVRRNRERSQKNFKEHSFLFDWAAQEMKDRLAFINRSFSSVLQIGGHTMRALEDNEQMVGFTAVMDCASFSPKDKRLFVQAEEDFFPFGAGTLDLVLGAMTLHTVNDLPGALIQIRRSLKPDGLFLAAFFGGETLYELRDVLIESEAQTRGGISPRVFPFADKQQAGALLQRAGFALPVVDSEIITVTYPNLFRLMRDLRGMGEGNALRLRDKSFPGKTFFRKAEDLYRQRYSDPDGRIRASFEILFMIGWAPHESQQKPLRPGSAETSLAEALDTMEIKTGDRTKP